MTRRWYWIVGGVLVALPMLVPVIVSLLVIVRPPRTMGAVHWLGVTVRMALACGAMSFPWLFWLCPWLAGKDPHVLRAGLPKGYDTALRAMVWFPVGICFLIAIGFVFLNVSDRATLGRWTWQEDPFWLGWLSMALLVPLVPWTWWLSRQVQRRFRAMLLTHRTICRQCGYDLRGNPAATACPECGDAIARRPGTGEA